MPSRHTAYPQSKPPPISLLQICSISALSLHKKQSSTYNKYACGRFLYAPSIYTAYLQKGLDMPKYTLHNSQLHNFTASQLHSFTASQLHSFTASQLHSFTASQLHSVRAYSARTSFYSLIHNHIILTSSSHAYTVAAALCRLTFSESAAQTFRVRTSFKGACKNRSFIGWPYSKGVTDA